MRTASHDQIKHYFENRNKYPKLSKVEKQELANILLDKDSLLFYEVMYAFEYLNNDKDPRFEKHYGQLKYWSNHIYHRKPVRLDDDPGDLIDESTELDMRMAFAEIEFTFKNSNKPSPDDLYWQKINDVLVQNGHRGITINKKSYK